MEPVPFIDPAWRERVLGRKRAIIVLLAFVAVCWVASSVLSSSAEAVTYNLATDWSDSANPNAPWSYADGNGAITIHQSNWAPGVGFSTPQPAWAAAAIGSGHVVSWFRSVNTAYDFISGDVITHPWDAVAGTSGGAPSRLIWTSPFAAEIDLSGDVWLARRDGRDVSFDLLINGAATVIGDSSLADTSRISRDVFTLNNILVPQGNTVDLRFKTVGAIGVGDFVGVNLNIDATPVSEPATMLLLGSGLAGMGWFGRKRRKSDDDRQA